MNDRQMSDKELDEVLRTWASEAPAGHLDRSRVVSNVLRELHSTRRHRGWLTALFRARPGAPRPPNSTMSRPVQSRPRTAISPRISGGVRPCSVQSKPSPPALLRSPSAACSSSPSRSTRGRSARAATDEAPAAPVAVTATGAPGPCGPDDPVTETLGFVERTVGSVCQPTWTWSDERLNGEVTWASDRRRVRW